MNREELKEKLEQLRCLLDDIEDNAGATSSALGLLAKGLEVHDYIQSMQQHNPIHEAIEAHWGARCPEHEDGCPVCEVWGQYDRLVGVRILDARLGDVPLDEADVMRNFGATANL